MVYLSVLIHVASAGRRPPHRIMEEDGELEAQYTSLIARLSEAEKSSALLSVAAKDNELAAVCAEHDALLEEEVSSTTLPNHPS